MRNANNDYLIDREMQRTRNYTGIGVVHIHLGTTDAAVIAARRRLLKMARDLQDGIEPIAALKPETYNVRAVDQVSPEADFSRFMDLYAEAALGKV